jgi:hypothetical protein
MEHRVTHEEAQAGLDAVEHGRRRVVDEIDVPGWYWWGLAAGWVVLGLFSDFANPWVTVVATAAFGALHASIAPRVVDGRHRTRSLSVSAETVGRRVPVLVIGGLLVLVVVTVAVALAVDADGARHPSTTASILVATVIALGGPQLLAGIRRRAARGATQS